MVNFTLTIPDELLPALTAEFLIVSTAGATGATSAEEYFAASIVETLRQRAEIYKVGPYFEGVAEPRFLADGMPNPAYTGADAIVLPPEPDLDIGESPEDNGSDFGES
jgi:hypothetical protein